MKTRSMNELETNLFVALKACMEVETQLIRCIEKSQEDPTTQHAGNACPIEDRIEVLGTALEALRSMKIWLAEDDYPEPEV